MKPVFIRRHRRRNTATKSEGAFFKKEGQETFFGGGERETFFQPANTTVPAQQSVQRKCEECSKEDKEVQRQPEKKEEEKVMKSPLALSIQQGISPKKIQKKDSDFEYITGVGDAILDGTMKADSNMGKTITADNCRSTYGCNVGFRFDKLYKGSYMFKAARRKVNGVYTRIASVYDPKICGDCDRLRMIQVIRYVTKGSAGNIETAKPTTDTRTKRAGWNDPKARSRGWFVDKLDTESVAFRDDPYRYSFDSQTGVGKFPAIAWDAPASFTNMKNDGKEFQTFLVCEPNTGGKGKVLAGVNWGYYIDSTGNIDFMPATPIATCGPTEELQNSAERWDTLGNVAKTRINFAAEKPVNHYGSQSPIFFKEGDVTIQNNELANSEDIYELALKKTRQHLMATLPNSKIILHCYSGKGEGKLNADLSMIRADNVRAKLVAAGIPGDVIEIKQHKGETVNQSKLDENRKVVIELSDTVDRALTQTLLRSF